MNAKKVNIHFVYILLAAAFWGISGIFVRTIQNYNISEMTIVLGRSAVSSVLLFILIVLKDISLFKIRIKDLWLFISAGLFSIVLFNFCYYKTMAMSTLSVAAVLLYTAPFFVVILSSVLFNKRITLKKGIAVFVAFFGCALVSGVFGNTQRIGYAAIVFGILTGFGYALYTIFGELLLKRGYNTLTITFYVFLSAFLCTIPFINFKNTYSLVKSEPSCLIIIFLMALFNTVLPYILYTIGLTGVDSSIAPIIAMVEPIVATIVGIVFFNEGITFTGICGIILVLISVAILNIKSISVRANAKINLVLSVNGKRDDGYHFIDTVMQSIDLFDRVTVRCAKKITVKCGLGDIQQEDNIAYKAAQLFFKETKINSGASIKIKKHIPIAAGLGGGSSNAAAVLIALNKLYEKKLTVEQLENIALKLGADVPFFIRGGTLRAQGIGEQLSELKPFEKGWFVLIKANEKPSTKEMYNILDSQNPIFIDVDLFEKALVSENYNDIEKLMDNSFAAVWQNDYLEEMLKQFNPNKISLSGSGPTIFAYFNNKRRAKDAYLYFKNKKIECYFTKPVDKAIIIE